MIIQSEFGKFIKDARLQVGLSQHEASIEFGISHVHLGSFERNDTGAVPNSELLSKMSKIYFVPKQKLKVLAIMINPFGAKKLLTKSQQTYIRKTIANLIMKG